MRIRGKIEKITQALAISQDALRNIPLISSILMPWFDFVNCLVDVATCILYTIVKVCECECERTYVCVRKGHQIYVAPKTNFLS
jgi:hypothetical protein